MRTRFAQVWDAYSSSRRRQRPIGFPPGVRDVHSAHPLRHATQVAKSSRDRLRRGCCLAAPRAREARRHGSVRDGARRRQNRLTRRRRGIARRRGAARCSGAKACVAALASDAHLIPERPAWSPSAAAELRMAWEELPRRNRRWRVFKNWALKPGVLCVGELWTLEAEHALGAAAAGAPRLATGAEPTRLASFWHVHLLRALRCSGSVTHA